jgi:predicted HicB family RNase H-like nuclease
MMTYKGYQGVAHVDTEAGVIRGKVHGLRDMITFQGKTVEEAEQAFRESVDIYLEHCEALGKPPEKPFSGKFLVRVDPEVHRELALMAQVEGVSLNGPVRQTLTRLAQPEQ